MNVRPRSILVPVDFEPDSRRAIRYARALASTTGAELCLLYVMPPAAGAAHGSRDAWWMSLAERTLAGVAERAKLPPGTRTEVLRGPVAATVADFAAREGFDLIIVGGHAAPDWHGSLIGPTAAQILKHSRIPALLVPRRVKSSAERRSA